MLSQRSAGVFSIRIHPRMKPDKFLDVTDFNGSGADVLVLMRALLVGLPSGAVRDDLKMRYVSIESLDPAARRLTGRPAGTLFGVVSCCLAGQRPAPPPWSSAAAACGVVRPRLPTTTARATAGRALQPGSAVPAQPLPGRADGTIGSAGSRHLTAGQAAHR